eukprot:81641-Chlamydomonas_euryale.AAC.2
MRSGEQPGTPEYSLTMRWCAPSAWRGLCDAAGRRQMRPRMCPHLCHDLAGAVHVPLPRARDGVGVVSPTEDALVGACQRRRRLHAPVAFNACAQRGSALAPCERFQTGCNTLAVWRHLVQGEAGASCQGLAGASCQGLTGASYQGLPGGLRGALPGTQLKIELQTINVIFMTIFSFNIGEATRFAAPV